MGKLCALVAQSPCASHAPYLFCCDACAWGAVGGGGRREHSAAGDLAVPAMRGTHAGWADARARGCRKL